MGLKLCLAGLVAAASSVLAHPGHHEKVYYHAPERRDLSHCDKHFNAPEFKKRTVEAYGEELHRLRRGLGLETEDR